MQVKKCSFYWFYIWASDHLAEAQNSTCRKIQITSVEIGSGRFRKVWITVIRLEETWYFRKWSLKKRLSQMEV